MIITDHREKLINAIIYFAKNTKFCGKTKLMKLLYYLDFYHFKETGKSVTGESYEAWKMGPVPKKTYEELSGTMRPDMEKGIQKLPEEGFQKIIPKKKFESDYFSKRELRILKEVSFIFKDTKADQMVASTHLKNDPWHKTLKEKGKNQEIDYLLAIDQEGSRLSYEEAKDRVKERQEIHDIFGVA